MKKIIKSLSKNVLFHYLPVTFKTYREADRSDNLGISTLLCHNNVNLFIWNLTSFFHFSEMAFPVYIVNDGTLTEADCQKIKKHFNAVIESNQTSEKRIYRLIKPYKYICRFRFDDFCLSQHQKQT